MKNFQKTVRLLMWVLLIVLASLGVGISGGVPIPKSTNRKDTEKETIDLTEESDEEEAE